MGIVAADLQWYIVGLVNRQKKKLSIANRLKTHRTIGHRTIVLYISDDSVPKRF